MMNELLELIEHANTIGIFGHIRPDGDCVGSCLGLYNYIRDNYDVQVTVYLEKIPDKFNFLKGADAICHEVCDNVPDLAISLDCSDRDRHGIFYDLYGNAKHKACLDHHRSNQGFGDDYYYCDPDASSTCEVLYRHLNPDKLSLTCAECIYLGIVHDTGVFKFSACREETMQIAGKLITQGVDAQRIIDETFYKVSYKQNLLTGQAMLQARLALSGQVVYTYVTKEMFRTFSCGKEETEGIVDRIRVVDGVEVAILVYQLEKEDTMKVSLRSISKVDVSKIAVAYGGGGHIRAAGFEVTGDFETVLARILEMIEEQL
ncbi:MAG: bifunctional oligoribonuclease/PAP phosphatase NrnA [Wujia sp.]